MCDIVFQPWQGREPMNLLSNVLRLPCAAVSVVQSRHRDILMLLPGKSSAELRSKIINVFVRFVGGGV